MFGNVSVGHAAARSTIVLGLPTPSPSSRQCCAHRRVSVPRKGPARLASRSGLPTSGAVPPGGSGPTDKGYGGGGSGDGDDSELTPGALLLAGKASLDGLPSDIARAIVDGTMPPDVLDRFLAMRKNPLLRVLLGYDGFRARLLADPNFLIKVGIELGIGMVMKVTAEYTKRGEKFGEQLDFVCANIVMALVADWMLVWLPAPTFVPGSHAARPVSANPLTRIFAGCPENAFQRVPPGYDRFTFAQRVGAVVRNGLKLGGVGFGASLLGVGVTNAISIVRAKLDPTYAPLNAPQNVLVMSTAYGGYMSSSANLRYQIVAGILEERGVEAIFHNNPSLCAALSFLIRTGNTFVGSLLWVDFLRFFNLQPKA